MLPDFLGGIRGLTRLQSKLPFPWKATYNSASNDPGATLCGDSCLQCTRRGLARSAPNTIPSRKGARRLPQRTGGQSTDFLYNANTVARGLRIRPATTYQVRALDRQSCTWQLG